MNRAALLLAIAVVTTACGAHNPADVQVVPPNRVTDFNVLYTKNCSECHGPDGKGGAAIGLGDPLYLAIADDAAIRRVTASGVAGTSMPAFAQRAGGMLTDDQIDVIIHGIRKRWARPDALRGADAPPYSAQVPGDAKRGSVVYGAYCSSCHGTDGRRGKRAGSIVGDSYLALVSDQSLRTSVIVGRRDLGAPDWRGDIPGKPMSAEDVSDVVAWLIGQRMQFPGQPYASALQPEGGIR